MAILDFLKGQPLRSSTTFNWPWVVELITCIILVIFFLFYFNRLVATIISFTLRQLLWHRLRIWIDIQAIQLSFLAGRIFFKGLRYHGENETIFLQNGYITWRYWLRTSRKVDLTNYPLDDDAPKEDVTQESRNSSDASSSPENDAEVGLVRKIDTSEARLAINVTGLEWFVYNRTPAYDAILSQNLATEGNGYASVKLNESTAVDTDSGTKPKFRRNRKETISVSDSSRDSHADFPKNQPNKRSASEGLEHVETHSTATDLANSDTAVSSIYSYLLRLLPIAIEVSKGAVSLGNENTRAIVVTTFSKAKGHVDASTAGNSDIFRQMFQFDVEHPVVQMRPNPDFRRSQHAAAERIISLTHSAKKSRFWWRLNLRLRFRVHRLVRSIRQLFPRSNGSIGSYRTGTAEEKYSVPYATFEVPQDEDIDWHGLDRYLDDEDRDDHEGWANVEYARFSTILDSPMVALTFYWDLPGPVTAKHLTSAQSNTDQDINGIHPPAYGLDLVVKGADVNYGPWADRLRLEIQAAFFPSPYMTATPANKLNVGDWRQNTKMNIRVDIEEEVTLRVPTRERSKDWQWRGRAQAVKEAAAARKQKEKKHFRFRRGPKTALGADMRPFGWLSVSVDRDSTVSYVMDMVPGINGYRNDLQLELKNTKATSGVNHALLWRCPLQKVSADLSNCLQWNGLHNWTFEIQNQSFEMFMLRDHMFLLTDLISDFTAGLKSDFMIFTPFNYCIKLLFNDLKLYLNANDQNIIDSPNDLDENSFLILGMEHLQGNVDIPLLYFSPRQSSVNFEAEGRNTYLELTTPPWNTLHTFLTEKTMATLKGLHLDGSYNYFTAMSPSLTDSLVMNISGLSPRFNLYGFLIRYFMNVKENYFGENLHFKTLEEYQTSQDGGVVQDPQPLRSTATKENDLDVILSVRAENSCAVLPANIYSKKDLTRVDMLLVEADMRFTNYYMDLQVNSSPLEASLETNNGNDQPPEVTACQLFIDSVSVFGHRLFGAPPTEPPYVCNWDIDVGDILGECSVKFLRTLVNSIQAFVFTMDDDENALPESTSSPLYDVTFLRVRSSGGRIWLLADQAAFLLEFAQADVKLNDWAQRKFAKDVQVNIPNIVLAAVDPQSATRHYEDLKNFVPTFACFRTSLKVAVLDKTQNLLLTRSLQQQYIRYHDQRTHRTDWLLHRTPKSTRSQRESEWSRVPPPVPIPMMPEPLLENHSEASHLRGASARKLRRTSSFLSSSIRSLRNVDTNDLHRTASKLEDPTKSSSSGRGSRTGSSIAPGKSFTHRAMNDGRHSTAGGFSKGLAPISSAWARPSFNLQCVQPDIRDMPATDDPQAQNLTKRHHRESDPNEVTEDSKGFAHMGLFLMLEKGLVGFCEPVLLHAIADLIRQMQPKTPLELLDHVQLSVMSTVKKEFGEKHINKCTDFTVYIPLSNIRLRNPVLDSPDLRSQHCDCADLRLLDCRLTARSTTRWTEDKDKDLQVSTLIGHASMKDLSLKLSDQILGSDSSSTYLKLSLTDIGLWWSAQDQIRGKLQLSSMKFALLASQTDTTVSLVQRAMETTDSLVDAFGSLDQMTALQHLVFHLTEPPSITSDPTFLTRPAYILRRAQKHIRLSNSWKTISHLRWIYLSLQKETPGAFTQCKCENFCINDRSRSQMVSSFQKWRGWDDTGDGEAPLIAVLFGKQMRTQPTAPNMMEAQFEIIIGRLAFVLNPGSHQSDLTIIGIDSAIYVDTLTSVSLIDSPSRVLRQKLVLQNHVADFAINLDWALLPLVEGLIRQVIPTTQHEPKWQPLLTEATAPVLSNRELTITVGADMATIYLSSPNLKLQLGAAGLRSSFNHVSSEDGMEQSVATIASDAATAKLSNSARALLVWRLASPKVYASIQPGSTARQLTLVHVGAACRKLRFNMKAEITDMLKAIKFVIDDEIRALHRLSSSLPTQHGKGPPQTDSVNLSDRVKIHMAMFLDDYRLGFLLSPFLVYEVAGKVARTSVNPGRRSSLEIDFDLKSQGHVFKNTAEPTDPRMSLLRIPPINGRVVIGQSKSLTIIRARTTVEQVDFEAAAVRACFDALNQSSVLRALNGIKPGIEQIKVSIAEIFGPPEKSRPVDDHSTSSLIQFSVKGTLAGIGMHFRAPAIRSNEYQADLNFKLGATSLYIHNKAEEPNRVQERPQFRIRLQEISVGLDRKTKHGSMNFGSLGFGIQASGMTELDEGGNEVQSYRASSSALNVELFEETATLVLDLIAFLQERIKSIQLADEARKMPSLRRFTVANLGSKALEEATAKSTADDASETTKLLDSVYSLNLDLIRVRWRLRGDEALSVEKEPEDLVFSIRKIDFYTRRDNAARLSILDLQLQIVSRSVDPVARTANSALLPEVIFSAAYFSTKEDRRFAFQAKGKALDLRLSADFILPASALQKSLANASAELRQAEAWWATTPQTTQQTPVSLLGRKRLASLLVDADFAGAVVNVTPRREEEQQGSVFGILKGSKRSRAGRYGQVVQGENAPEAALQAPGIALKIEYRDNGKDDPALSGELKVAGSSNTLYPSVVPLILEISSSIKEILGEDSTADSKEDTRSQRTNYLSNAAMNNGDPVAILGRCKLNAGIWIERQEFSLSCQPIARVAATAKFDDIFVTINTIQTPDHDRFFSILTTFNNLQAAVQHVYSRESTASFEVESIVISLMNSKHVSSNVGISAILNISPMKTDINAKQLQDFLLFREIWYPAELRKPPKTPAPVPTVSDSQVYAIQRYQQLAASATLPWSAIVSVQELKLQIDLGPSLGKSVFQISKLWAFSKKNSDSKQNLCIGFEKVGVDCTGRMSGFVELQNFRVRTSIRWPHKPGSSSRAPLVQGSVGFDHLRVKAAFEYQPFAVADISTFDFLMYNVRQGSQRENDRLVGILNGGKIQAFCTAGTAAQILALVQAFERLIQEKQEAFEDSLRELDRFLRRKSIFPSSTWTATSADIAKPEKAHEKGMFSLHVDVVVTLNQVEIGAFPSTFFDSQILKVEAIDAQMRFAVATTDGTTHCGLGMTLGQVRVALSSVNRANTKALGEVAVPEVIERASSSKGGTILKVPRLVASMQTRQQTNSNVIEYIFKSTFEGKVDIGWNYSRISFIRGMWQTHSRALAQRLGKPLPPSAVKITAEPHRDGPGGGQEKITAVVNVPQSKFQYVALEPPIIDTPQLRDMGEATPPLEWIGLHRDKLPEATHSIIVVTLIEIAREVEDAYTRILGSS